MPSRARARSIALVGAVSLVAAACGGGGDSGEAADVTAEDEDVGEAPDTEDADDPVLDNPKWRRVTVGPEERDAQPAPGGELVVALEGETNTYLPSSFQGSQASFNVVFAIFDPLVTRDVDGELRPYLAESIEPNDDFTEWTLTLRPGVQFHDGTPLDAEALRRNFDDYLMAEGTLTRLVLARFVERMEVDDELTVRYVLLDPHPQFPELLELPMGWPFSPETADRLGDAFGDQPVGTGPFRFVSWQRDGDFVAERNPDYWQDGQPYLDRVTFRTVPDETTRAVALSSGDVDAAQGTRLSDFVAAVADIDGVQVSLGRGNNGGGMLFNTDEPPTDDVRVRQALAHAVDQAALVEVVAGEAAELTEVRTQLFPPGSPFHSPAVDDAWPDHDPERARELLAEYVDDPQRSDGEAPGEPVSLTITTTGVAGLVEQATAFEGFYQEIGVDVTVEQVEQVVSIAKAVGGDYQVLAFRKGDNRSPLGELLFYFDDPAEVPSNFSNFHSDTVEELIAGLRTTDDLDEQVALTEQLGLHLAEQLPWQWTGSELTLVAAADEVQGVRSWTFPDGTLGNGALAGVTMWSQVWLCDPDTDACA